MCATYGHGKTLCDIFSHKSMKTVPITSAVEELSGKG